MMSGIIQEIKTGTGVSLNIWNEDSVLSRSKFISEVVSRLIPDELIDLSN
jgi:chorismate synthase